MTLDPVPPPAPVVRGRGRPSIVLGALVTSACVAAGSAVALSTLHSLETPTEVATTYLEARYAGDWDTAWAMQCATTHLLIGNQSRFAEGAASWDEYLALPPHVAVEISGGIHPAEGFDSFVSVTATVTSSERRGWSLTGEVPLLMKNNQIRVCDGGLSLGHGFLD